MEQENTEIINDNDESEMLDNIISNEIKRIKTLKKPKQKKMVERKKYKKDETKKKK